MVGVGAVIFHDLFNQSIKNIEFFWKDVFSFEGTTEPYAQYTYARTKNILRNSNGKMVLEKSSLNNVSIQELTDDVTYSLVKTLSGYEDAVLNAAEKYEPSIVARYVISLATSFNKFYHECLIMQAGEETKAARLFVTSLVQGVLNEACNLLGIECSEEM